MKYVISSGTISFDDHNSDSDSDDGYITSNSNLRSERSPLVNNYAHQQQSQLLTPRTTTSSSRTYLKKRISSDTHSHHYDSFTHDENDEDEVDNYKRIGAIAAATKTTVSSLNEAEDGRNFTYNITLLKEIRTSKRWRWSFCVVSVIAVLLFLVATSLITYNSFFRPPYVLIEQIQIYHLPFSDQKIGFQIMFSCSNPNIAAISIQNVALAMTIYDAHSGSSYNIAEPIEYNWNASTAIVSRWSSAQFNVAPLIFIGDCPYYPQILDLVARNIYVAFSLKGKITTKIGTFYHSQSIDKYQQYYINNE